MTNRTKLGLSLLGVLACLFVADTAYEALKTLRQLDTIEAERDQWQRPSEIIAALDLRPGSTVVDLGCGSGYFALKLSAAVGSGGAVQAVDIRRLPLMFLWARAIRKDRHNINRVLSEPNDPRLPSGAHAVLIANTYHELDDRDAILDRVFQSLVSGGRLVVVDPMRTEHGTLTYLQVEDQLRRHGFDIVQDDGGFIHQPERGAWWLVVARKP